MTIEEMIADARKRGWYFACLCEVKVGVWRCDFDRVDYANEKPRTRSGEFTADPYSAVKTAYEELIDPGIRNKRELEQANAKWATTQEPKAPKAEKPVPDISLEKLLLDNPGLRIQLEDSLKALLNCLNGTEEEEEFL